MLVFIVLYNTQGTHTHTYTYISISDPIEKVPGTLSYGQKEEVLLVTYQYI